MNIGKKISIVGLLYRHSPKALVCSIMLGSFSGVLYSLIIPLVLSGINQQVKLHEKISPWIGLQNFLDKYFVALFFSLCISILIAKVSSLILINNIAKSATAELRADIAKKINSMSVAGVESVGLARLLNILGGDVHAVAAASTAIPALIMSVLTVISMLCYLASLNLMVFVFVSCAIIGGAILYQVPIFWAVKRYQKARTIADKIQEAARGLVLGVYELKLSKKKSMMFLDEEFIIPQLKSVSLSKQADSVFYIAASFGELIVLYMIGVIVFLMPKSVLLTAVDNYAIVMVLLSIGGPMAAIMGVVPQFLSGQVALARIGALNDLDEECVVDSAVEPLAIRSRFGVRNVAYKYQNLEDGRNFFLSPISLMFYRGEINFIVGPNGSGKSTLAKLLSLHYLPSEGCVFFDDAEINSGNILGARSNIAVIYSNYYLFSRVYQNFESVDEERIKMYLDWFGLTGKTEIVNGVFTTTDLSDGQRRRLALIVALLEDKEIYFFDEWAADQDPGFKKVFYEDVLPFMRRANKFVIVITHDDRYFECADRLIFMDSGNVVLDEVKSCRSEFRCA
jgi:putative pyoverdin transport system ATP-binding/permease protein